MTETLAANAAIRRAHRYDEGVAPSDAQLDELEVPKMNVGGRPQLRSDIVGWAYEAPISMTPARAPSVRNLEPEY